MVSGIQPINSRTTTDSVNAIARNDDDRYRLCVHWGSLIQRFNIYTRTFNARCCRSNTRFFFQKS